MSELHVASQAFWKDKIDAIYCHSDERLFQLYAQELLAMLPQGGILLDVGCGSCQITTYLADAFDGIVAIDFSDSMLAAGRDRIGKQKRFKISLMKGEATKLPVEATSADVILANGVIQYLDAAALQSHLSECARVLKPGGIICWGLVPNARLRRLWYAGALTNPRPSLVQMIMRSVRWHYRWLGAIRNHDWLWDGIGAWFNQEELRALCDRAEFSVEFRNCWFSGYRLHALLRRREISYLMDVRELDAH
jgi:ubiquinone/menaquinone biosynthesis C-methylase UbiE